MINFILFSGVQMSSRSTWIHLIDSGGQPQFHHLFPLFIRNTSYIFYVLKLSEGLHTHPKIEYYVDGKPTKNTFDSPLTQFDILKHVINSKTTTTTKKEDSPQIIIIGTHKDILPTQNFQELIEYLTKPNIRGRVFFCGKGMGNPIFKFNCKFPKSCDKDMARELRRTITSELTGKITFKTPIRWFGLEIALKKASSNGIISIAQAERESLQFKMEKVEFDYALKHLLNHNIILYYPHISELSNAIFCEPQILFEKLNELVQECYTLQCEVINDSTSIPTSGRWLKFRDYGIITLNLLSKFEKNYDQHLFTPAGFLSLLSSLYIVAHIDDGEYLMPALLKHNKAIIPLIRKPVTDKGNICTPLCISFHDGYVSSAVFCCTVAHLLQNKLWVLNQVDDKPSYLFCNCVSFIYGSQTTATLMDFSNHFELLVTAPHAIEARVCKEIRKHVHEAIKLVSSNICGSELTFQDAICCPIHMDHLALLKLEPDQCFQCTGKNAEHGSIPEEYKKWFNCTIHTSSMLKIVTVNH